MSPLRLPGRPAASSPPTRPSDAVPSSPASENGPLLHITDLAVAYGGPYGANVLDGVDLTVDRGEIIGLIGETGSGKTTLARAVVGLVPARSGRITVDGVEVSALRRRRLRAFRRTGRVQFVFQDPLRALDPELTVRTIVTEPLAVAGTPAGSGTSARGERVRRAHEALQAVGLDPGLSGRVPGRLSGGQRQRVLLARALVTRPALLLCDEPVSALDAANRTHVMTLLARLRETTGTTIVIISHDLYSLAGIADRIAVLHGGRIVERGPVRSVMDSPQHPYTARLVAAAPRLRRASSTLVEAGV